MSDSIHSNPPVCYPMWIETSDLEIQKLFERCTECVKLRRKDHIFRLKTNLLFDHGLIRLPHHWARQVLAMSGQFVQDTVNPWLKATFSKAVVAALHDSKCEIAKAHDIDIPSNSSSPVSSNSSSPERDEGEGTPRARPTTKNMHDKTTSTNVSHPIPLIENVYYGVESLRGNDSNDAANEDSRFEEARRILESLSDMPDQWELPSSSKDISESNAPRLRPKSHG